MGLFGFGKKEKQDTSCSCGAVSAEKQGNANVCCAEAEKGICCIKVLGTGCKNCHDLLENAEKAVKEMGLTVEVEYVTDLQKIMDYGVMSMPCLVVNEKVVSVGKVLKAADIEELLKKYTI